MEHKFQSQGEIDKSQKVQDMDNLKMIHKTDLKDIERIDLSDMLFLVKEYY